MDKLLVVDDQEGIRVLIYELLGEDFELKLVCSGEEAIEESKSFKPDIILLDIGLSGISGVDALPKLKETVPKSSVVMLTGNTDGLLIEKALALGACDYITKPFDIFSMRNKILDIKQSSQNTA